MQPVLLHYAYRRMSPSWDSVPWYWYAWRLLSQASHTASVTWLDVQRPSPAQYDGAFPRRTSPTAASPGGGDGGTHIRIGGGGDGGVRDDGGMHIRIAGGGDGDAGDGEDAAAYAARVRGAMAAAGRLALLGAGPEDKWAFHGEILRGEHSWRWHEDPAAAGGGCCGGGRAFAEVARGVLAGAAAASSA